MNSEAEVTGNQQQRHDADMKLKAEQAMALKALTCLLVIGGDLAKAYSNNFAFGTPEAIRAQACALIVEAAHKSGTADDLKAGAEKLLQVAKSADPVSPAVS